MSLVPGVIAVQALIQDTNPVEVFDALTDPLLVQFWSPYEFVMEPGVGGVWSFQRDQWAGPAVGAIEAIDQGRSLRMRFSGVMQGVVTIALKQAGRGVLVRLSHERAQDTQEPTEVWTACLGRLKEYLEAKAP